MSASTLYRSSSKPTVRPHLAPLNPLSDSLLNAVPIQGEDSRKRKRCNGPNDTVLGRPITIQPHSLTPHYEKVTLTPCILLPRSSLPLVFLKTDACKNGSPQSRIFSAWIPALEQQDRGLLENTGPRTLITRDEKGYLYAVEDIHQNVFVMCRLHDWVSMEDFSSTPSKARKIRSIQPMEQAEEDKPWWKAAAIDIPRRGGEKSVGLPRFTRTLPMQLSMKPSCPGNPNSDTQVDLAAIDQVTISQDSTQKVVEPTYDEIEASVCNVTEDIFGMIRVQYLEALYMSKTSLAYFAKGPLSRARVATQQPASSLTSFAELVQFLRDSILSVPTNNKKYDKSLPELITELPVGIASEDEAGYTNARIRKSKTRRKIGKNGFFPEEEVYVLKWWLRREKTLTAEGPEDTRERRTKRALVEQRARETQLQIILILEILALEAAGTAQGPKDLTMPNVTNDSNEDKHVPDAKKSKKPQDLSTLLDVLIERLCIWQTTNLEDSMSSGDKTKSVPQKAEKEGACADDGDRLRDFCSEVIVPFYATRLPNLYPKICKQLGGPSRPSPPRPTLYRMITTSRNGAKPATSGHRSQHGKPRKTLERVLTDEKVASQRRPPSLMRSATDSALPNLKRELSEVPLSSIPTSKQMLHQSRREVDLTAIFQATEAKRKRKAAIEEELKGAITALKKPNPRMAVKELVESAERRSAGIGFKTRKSRNPIHNPFAPGIQVMATPKGNRRRDHYQDLSPLPANCNTQPQEPEFIPPSSGLRIPSSSIKPSVSASLEASDTSLNPFSVCPSIEQTPSRRSSKLARSSLSASMCPDEDQDELSQPSPNLPPLRAASKPFKRPSLPGRTPSLEGLRTSRTMHDTPSRTRHLRYAGRKIESLDPNMPFQGSVHYAAAVESTPKSLEARVLASSPVVVGGDSIYQALGWDDADVDDLA